MRKHTHLAHAISVADNMDVTYDKYVKELLANKQILSRIIKYTMEEFAEETLEEIQNNIGDVEIGSVYVDPGFTNTMKAPLCATEDYIVGEGEIRYDIRFVVHTKNKKCYKILMNVEAQRSADSGKLGYHLENRIIYYMARMISSQKETEFCHSDYDSLKKICSIWICLDGKADEDTIEEVKLKKRNIYGNGTDMNFDLLRGIIIRLRNVQDVETSKNILISMLEDLFVTENAEKKKKQLSHKYGMIMDMEMEGQVNQMCNVSQWVREMGKEEGREEGIERGTELTLLKLVKKGLLAIEDAAKEMGITVEEFQTKLK